ncbi:TPA: carbohydrate ABC transporter permease [Candidatus Galligastranaerophilus faecipullorum]|nr:carbohydrate ABC transporter permease [Candidatus Galligastranaerophilus faecipullorum]
MRTVIKNFFKGLSAHIILILVCILSLLPFIWLLSTALKGAQENIFQYPPEFLPKFPTLDNFKEVLRLVPIVGYVVNSFIVAAFTVVLNLILSAMAAYPLARMEFAGKKIAFFAVLATIMVPFQAIMLPVYIITLKLNLVDSYGIIPGFMGMILPFAVNAFGIFLLRQAFLSIPKELEESAVVDGCSSWQIFFRILLPMIKPSLAVLAIFTFIGSWGDFLWPSIVLTNEKLFTLPVGINNLQGAFSANYRLIAAGSMISIVPIVVFFVSLQKYFISGANEGAVKG